MELIMNIGALETVPSPTLGEAVCPPVYLLHAAYLRFAASAV